ncbi:MAG: hypothetical protein ISQ70_02350 [Pirellulales bacterium]|nr:hypothetical protein [Pirellulales bacterium]MBL7193309.1 hypothetical protein [Pirellulales bacterium]
MLSPLIDRLFAGIPHGHSLVSDIRREPTSADRECLRAHGRLSGCAGERWRFVGRVTAGSGGGLLGHKGRERLMTHAEENGDGWQDG